MIKVTHLMSILVVTSTIVVGSCGYALIDAPPPEYQSMQVQSYHFNGYNPLCNTNRMWSWLDVGAGAGFLAAGLVMLGSSESFDFGGSDFQGGSSNHDDDDDDDNGLVKLAGGGLTITSAPFFLSAKSGRAKTSACRNWRNQVLQGKFIPETVDDSTFSSFGPGALESLLPIRRPLSVRLKTN